MRPAPPPAAGKEPNIDTGITRGTRQPDRAEPPNRPVYHIRVKGHLDPRWTAWFDDMTITPEPNGTTLLTGPIVDQAALHATLTRIRDLGMPLVSVVETDPAEPGGPNDDARNVSSEESSP